MFWVFEFSFEVERRLRILEMKFCCFILEGRLLRLLLNVLFGRMKGKPLFLSLGLSSKRGWIQDWLFQLSRAFFRNSNFSFACKSSKLSYVSSWDFSSGSFPTICEQIVRSSLAEGETIDVTGHFIPIDFSISEIVLATLNFL